MCTSKVPYSGKFSQGFNFYVFRGTIDSCSSGLDTNHKNVYDTQVSHLPRKVKMQYLQI